MLVPLFFWEKKGGELFVVYYLDIFSHVVMYSNKFYWISMGAANGAAACDGNAVGLDWGWQRQLNSWSFTTWLLSPLICSAASLEVSRHILNKMLCGKKGTQAREEQEEELWWDFVFRCIMLVQPQEGTISCYSRTYSSYCGDWCKRPCEPLWGI